MADYLAKILDVTQDQELDEKKTKEIISAKLQGKKKRQKFPASNMSEDELRKYQEELFAKSKNFEWEGDSDHNANNDAAPSTDQIMTNSVPPQMQLPETEDQMEKFWADFDQLPEDQKTIVLQQLQSVMPPAEPEVVELQQEQLEQQQQDSGDKPQIVDDAEAD